ncbi:hypothetical protein KQ940_16495 [Marinobacterium sp. D7]|uniref:hypothetical protein n=1 Tax=Marinobacterium ramblicola TaxID=2849041 RepID=UPI001C2D2219|nr:hypothetical protein [Marinobacterium ramblicola]MBV1789655.1 hypothetical protein [Marinobacterium ramblicola]
MKPETERNEEQKRLQAEDQHAAAMKRHLVLTGFVMGRGVPVARPITRCTGK